MSGRKHWRYLHVEEQKWGWLARTVAQEKVLLSLTAFYLLLDVSVYMLFLLGDIKVVEV